MKKLVIAILVVVAFCWISVVSAENRRGEESPESFVTCGSGNGAGIADRSVPGTISVEQCVPFGDSHCALCITSLEDQGCNIIDVFVTHVEKGHTTTTYLLSCDGR
jgi:hypothetical protein